MYNAQKIIDIKTDIIPELYNRKFIYISET